MKRRVVITGMGVVCGNGADKNEFAAACFSGKSGIRECTAFNTEGLMTPWFGQAEGIQEENRFYSLLKSSAEEMMADAKADRTYIASQGRSCRMFFGSLLYSSDAYYGHSRAKQRQEEDDFLAHMNDYSSYAREITGVKGQVMVSSAACASGTTAAGMALDYIRSGLCDCAVVGGADALSVIAAYGFHSLKSLSHGICNPYDAGRDGISIGECGAFFFFESLEHALARGADICCEVTGYALGNDAYHMTSPEPDGSGAYRTMQAAVEDAGITASEIDYINGHGTGTRINDDMETKAVERLLSETDKKVALSSTKSMVGHCMGASGAVELASVILSMQQGRYIPMPRLQERLTDSEKLLLSDRTFDLEIRYALSNSFAFGGNSASIVVKRYTGGGME